MISTLGVFYNHQVCTNLFFKFFKTNPTLNSTLSPLNKHNKLKIFFDELEIFCDFHSYRPVWYVPYQCMDYRSFYILRVERERNCQVCGMC